MNDTIIFYTNPMSRSQIIRWMLEEVKAPYDQKLIQYGEEMKSPSYLSINPMGKVPAIQHKGEVVTECAAICAYLADAFPEAGMAPPLDQRASYYRWLFFAAGPLESAVLNKNLGFNVTEEQQRTAGYGNFDLTIDTLAKAVTEKPFIAGDSFTAADVYVGSHIGWGIHFNTLPEREEFTEYFNKLKDRPAYIKAKQIDESLMKSVQN